MNVEVLPASVVRRLPDPSLVPVWAMVSPGGGVMWIETDCQVFTLLRSMARALADEPEAASVAMTSTS